MSVINVRMTLMVLCVMSVMAASSRSLFGEEPAKAFLDALREQGYYDLALEYLDRMQTSRLATNSFKETLGYEKAAVLIDSSKVVRDEPTRVKQLDLAESLLTQFVNSKRSHVLVSSAQSKLATLLFERAYLNIQNSKKPDLTSAEQQKLLDSARDQFKKASETLNITREFLKERLTRIPVGTRDEALRQTRMIYESEYLTVRLLLPVVQEQMADTYPANSKEQKELLKKAAAEYESYANDYQARYRAAFFRGRLYQGRCLEKLGELKEALICFNDIFEAEGDEDALRQIKKEALLIASKCWLANDPKQFLELIQVAEPLILTLKPHEASDPQWQEIELLLAKTYRDAVTMLQSNQSKTASDRKRIATYNNRSIDVARRLTRASGPYKREAQTLLATWGVGQQPVEEVAAPPETFAEAKDRAKKLLDAFETSRVMIETLNRQLVETDVDEQKKKILEQLDASELIFNRSSEEIIQLCQLASELVDDDTSSDDLGIVRYYQCYMYRWNGDLYESIALGEYQLERFPNANGTRQCADIACGALWQLYLEEEGSKEFELSHLTQNADTMLERWPGTPEANNVARIMNQVMLRERNIERADDYLKQIPSDSPAWMIATLDTGYRMWSDYRTELEQLKQLEESGIPEGMDLESTRQKLAEMKDQAMSYLESGMKSLEIETINRNRAIASLSLASAYLEDDQIDKAILHLETPRVGALALMRAGHDSVANEDIRQSISRVALHAYLLGLKSTSNPKGLLEKIDAAIADVNSTFDDSQEARNTAAAIFYAEAIGLKKRLGETAGANRQSMALGVARLLEEVRTTSNQIGYLVGTAAALTELGEYYVDANMEDQAKIFFELAESTLLTMLDQEANKKLALGAPEKREIMRRLAQIKRNQGGFADAIKLFAKVLSERSAIDVQIEATRTYQMWAADQNSKDHYAKAMLGGEPRVDPKTRRKSNAIWGWGKLAQTTAKYPDFRDTFFLARYNLAFCRFEYAQLLDSDKYREMAKRDIASTVRLYPDLGGGETKLKFDDLLKRIQTSLKEPAKGLASL